MLRRGLAALCAVVMLLTYNAIRFEADTLERVAMCGFEYDLVHDESCYDADGNLTCELHEHTDACYQQRPVHEVPAEEAPVEDGLLEAEDEVPEIVADVGLGEPDVLDDEDTEEDGNVFRAPAEKAPKYDVEGESIFFLS